MKRIFVIVESLKDHRYERFIEEASKLDEKIEVIGINAYKILVSSKDLFYQGEKINFTKNDYCWLLSNSTMNYFIIKKLARVGLKRMWPAEHSIMFADKFLTADFFERNDIPTPKTSLLSYENISEIESYLGGFPLIIKKNVGTVGRDVEIVKNKKEVAVFIQRVFDRVRGKTCSVSRVSFILQEFLKESSGVDYRALCLDGDVLGVIQRTAQDGNFKANISLGGTAKQVPIEKGIEKMCKKILKKGKIFYAGIDFIKTNRGYLALEINTSAQFHGFEGATGINVAEKILTKLIK